MDAWAGEPKCVIQTLFHDVDAALTDHLHVNFHIQTSSTQKQSGGSLCLSKYVGV